MLTAVPGRGAARRSSSAARRFPAYGYDLRSCAKPTPAKPDRTRRAWWRSCRRCRRAACPRCGATTSASSRPTSRRSATKHGLLDLRLGHPRQGRLLLHPRAHRRRDQRRRPPPGHARDRGGGAARIRTSRNGRGRRRRPLKGQMPLAFAVVEGRGEDRQPRRARGTGEGGDGDCRPAARRDRAAGARALRHAAAEDALGQAAAPLDPGARRRPRPGRSDHDRGSRRAGADQAAPRWSPGRDGRRWRARSGSSATPSARSRCRPTRLWGAQTQRSLEHFRISGERMPRGAHPRARAGQARLRDGEPRRSGALDRRRPTRSSPPPTRCSPAGTTRSSRSSCGRPAPARRPT